MIDDKTILSSLHILANMRMGLDERELEARLAVLNKELAKAAEELVRASSISVESETAAVQAALVAERAAEEAAKIQVLCILSFPLLYNFNKLVLVVGRSRYDFVIFQPLFHGEN